MASRTVTTFIDDLDGTEDARNVRFSLDDAHYEIDLSEQHAQDLREALNDYIGHARRLSPTKTGSARRSSSTSTAARDYDAKQVRLWASLNDVEVPARGRVPLAVLAAYRAAHASA